MSTAALAKTSAAITADTAATANTIPIRDANGGVAANTATVTGLVNTGIETAPHTAIKTSAYTVASPTNGVGGDRFIYYDTSGGAFAITLPLASETDGRIITFVNTANSTTALTLTPSGSDTCTNATLTTAYGYASYQSDGVSAWRRCG